MVNICRQLSNFLSSPVIKENSPVNWTVFTLRALMNRVGNEIKKSEWYACVSVFDTVKS